MCDMQGSVCDGHCVFTGVQGEHGVAAGVLVKPRRAMAVVGDKCHRHQ